MSDKEERIERLEANVEHLKVLVGLLRAELKYRQKKKGKKYEPDEDWLK